MNTKHVKYNPVGLFSGRVIVFHVSAILEDFGRELYFDLQNIKLGIFSFKSKLIC